MAPSTPDPPEVPETQEPDEDTFLFMGTRIPLPSETGKRHDLPSTGQARGTHSGKTLLSSKSSFDLQPLARSSRSSSSSRTFMLGGGLLFVAVMILFLWHRFGSTEAGMFQPATVG